MVATPGRRTLRAAAAQALERTLAARAPADRFLLRAGAGFDERDRRLLAELVYGALRWKLRIEGILERASGRKLDAIDPPLLPVLSVAIFQLLWLDRVPAHAAVSEAVDEARRRCGSTAAGFVNAVLRRIARAPDLADWPVDEPDLVRRLAIEQSHPEILVRRWLDRFGRAATESVLAANNGPREIHLLAFADRGGRARLAADLAAEGVATEPGRHSATALVVREGAIFESEAFLRGDFYVQDQASQLAAAIPPPVAGERILDAAAAPGGKGLAILAREPAARLWFADAAPSRLALLAANARRLRRELALVVADARNPPWSPGAFDRVVLDAPCTGTGTLRRHPELRWRFGTAELDRLAADAGAMLAALAPAVAVGGILIHITCSIEAEENEQVGACFLDAHSAFEADPIERLESGSDPAGTAQNSWRILPGEGHDGFSVGVFRRRR